MKMPLKEANEAADKPGNVWQSDMFQLCSLLVKSSFRFVAGKFDSYWLYPNFAFEMMQNFNVLWSYLDFQGFGNF